MNMTWPLWTWKFLCMILFFLLRQCLIFLSFPSLVKLSNITNNKWIVMHSCMIINISCKGSFGTCLWWFFIYKKQDRQDNMFLKTCWWKVNLWAKFAKKHFINSATFEGNIYHIFSEHFYKKNTLNAQTHGYKIRQFENGQKG